MRLLILLLVTHHVNASEIKTIDSSKYSFNVTQLTVNIMRPKEKGLADCIRELELKGISSDEAFQTCKRRAAYE